MNPKPHIVPVPESTDPAHELRQIAGVLSGDGGLYPALHELRDKLCLLDNGELLVIQGARLEQDVLAYEDLLRRNEFRYTVVTLTLSELRGHYSRSVVQTGKPSGNQTISNRQNQVLSLVRAAVGSGASDMHFIVDSDIAIIRHRVNGVLQTVVEMRGNDGMELCSTIYQSMCDVAETTFNPQKPQDGRLKREYLEAAGLYGARIATRPLERGLFMVLRLLYASRRREIDQLGYLPEQVAMIRRMTQRKDGVNFFAGETGSGKSSSLEVTVRMVLAYFNNEINVVTIEDPPEYRIPGAQQTPKGVGTWADAIRNAMRLDPDVLMVGEVRDYESAEAALQGALTGHSLWSTVHAKDAVAILQRLAEFRAGDERLNPGLYTDHTLVTGLINQNLVPTLCPRCKRPWTEHDARLLPQDQRERIERHCTTDTVFMRGSGCEACRSSGIPGIGGRSIVAEVIIPDHGFMRAFREHGKAEARDYWLTHLAGVTKREHLIRRINAGMIDPTIGEKKVGLIDEEKS